MNTKLTLIGLIAMVLVISACSTGEASRDAKSSTTKSVPTTGLDTSPQLPDLSISGITWSPQEPKAGQPVTFSVTVKNSGARDASNFLVALRRSEGDSGLTQTVRSLKAGKSTVVTFTTSYNSQGMNTLTAVADFAMTVLEVSEENNKFNLVDKAGSPVKQIITVM